MKYFVYLFFLFCSVGLQVGITDALSIYGIIPDFVLILLCLFALLESRSTVTVLGFLAGLILDVMSGGLLGLNALVKTFVSFIASTVFRKMTIHHGYEFGLLVFALAVFHSFVLDFMANIGIASFGHGFLVKGLPSAIYTVILAQILFSFIPQSFMRRIKSKNLQDNVS